MRPPARSSPFHAIADPTRRNLLQLLAAGDRSASELAEPFELTRSAVSQHLGILLDTGLVDRRKEGRRRIYSLRPEPLREVADWVAHFSAFWDDRLARLGLYLDRMEDEAPSAPDHSGDEGAHPPHDRPGGAWGEAPPDPFDDPRTGGS